MNDKYEELQKIFEKKIEEIDNKTHNEIIEICKKENLEYENIEDSEIKELLKEYYKEETED